MKNFDPTLLLKGFENGRYLLMDVPISEQISQFTITFMLVCFQ